MPVFPPSVEYTSKDFDSLRERLIALVRSVFPDWSDFSVASFGNVLLEMYAFVGDIVTYYLDAQARESRLVTATQRKNVIALARMLGLRLQGARAKATIRVSLEAPPTATVTLPVATIVRAQEVTEPIKFQVLAPIVIAAGSSRRFLEAWPSAAITRKMRSAIVIARAKRMFGRARRRKPIGNFSMRCPCGTPMPTCPWSSSTAAFTRASLSTTRRSANRHRDGKRAVGAGPTGCAASSACGT